MPRLPHVSELTVGQLSERSGIAVSALRNRDDRLGDVGPGPRRLLSRQFTEEDGLPSS